MSRVYDNWERLVVATLDREKLRELALASSTETSFSSSTSARFHPPFSFKFKSEGNHEPAGSYFLAAILLAEQVIKISENASAFKQECREIKSKAKKIVLLLRQAVGANHELYSRPMRHVMNATENVLRKAISLVLKCRGLKRVFATITSTSFENISSQLEHSVSNICWLLSDDHYRRIPPIAADEPVLYNIWALLAILHMGSAEDRSDAIVSLLSLARESDAYRTLIIEEGGVQPLLRLAHDRTLDAWENAMMVIALLAEKNSEVIGSEVLSVFSQSLTSHLPIRLYGTIAWAVFELVEIFEDYDVYNFVHMILQLVFKTLPEGRKVHLGHGVGGAGIAMRGNSLDIESNMTQTRAGVRATEKKDDEIDDYIKVMTTKVLWHLAKRSNWNCEIIAKSNALICFAFFLDRGPKEARLNSAMALMSITSLAELDIKVRRSTFEPNLPAYRAMVDQLIRIIDQEDMEVLVPCVTITGNLAWTFKDTDMRVVSPLVKLLYRSEPEVSREACIALSKFAHYNNRVCSSDNRKAIVYGGGLDP